MMKIVATAYAYDPRTNDWTKPVSYEARDRMEAIRWVNMNRDWMKSPRIETFERIEQDEPIDTDGDPLKGHRC